jgi:hypothetical protein
MRGVAADEGAPFAKAVGDQAAADPVFLAEDLVFEIGADAENGADRGVAIDRLEGLVFLVEVVMDQPFLAAVDRRVGAWI